MTEDPKPQHIVGHVFDTDGNPIGANLLLKRIEVDTEPCISVSGVDWYADRPGGLINGADDVQFCIPQSALPEPGIWTVVGIYADNLQPYQDHPDPQHQRWAEAVQANSADEAIEKVRATLAVDGATLIVAACLAGNVQVAA